jgi:hypothetical protein
VAAMFSDRVHGRIMETEMVKGRSDCEELQGVSFGKNTSESGRLSPQPE